MNTTLSKKKRQIHANDEKRSSQGLTVDGSLTREIVGRCVVELERWIITRLKNRWEISQAPSSTLENYLIIGQWVSDFFSEGELKTAKGENLFQKVEEVWLKWDKVNIGNVKFDELRVDLNLDLIWLWFETLFQPGLS